MASQCGREDVDQTVADVLGSALERISQLEAALETRSVIARAQGILMERYDIDADAAIAVLKRTSTALPLKVHHVSAMLVETRQLPREITGAGD
jgi:AmiR/NasT family two-component response regulator